MILGALNFDFLRRTKKWYSLLLPDYGVQQHVTASRLTEALNSIVDVEEPSRAKRIPTPGVRQLGLKFFVRHIRGQSVFSLLLTPADVRTESHRGVTSGEVESIDS